MGMGSSPVFIINYAFINTHTYLLIHKYTFLLGIYSDVGLPGPRIHVQSTLGDIAS